MAAASSPNGTGISKNGKYSVIVIITLALKQCLGYTKAGRIICNLSKLLRNDRSQSVQNHDPSFYRLGHESSISMVKDISAASGSYKMLKEIVTTAYYNFGAM